MSRRINNQPQPTNNRGNNNLNNRNMMMMGGPGGGLEGADLGGATVGGTQYNIVMTQDQVAQSFGAAGVLPSPYGYGGTPQLSQMSMDLVGADGNLINQQQQQPPKRRIVKEPEMDKTKMDVVNHAISKINKDNAWNTPLPAAHADYTSNVLQRLHHNISDGSGSAAEIDHFKFFAKAATLVETSTKVWAYRVDSTHMLSNQMLNRLRRNDITADGDGEGGEGGDGSGSPGSPHGKKNKKHKNRALARTIADSEKEINMEGFDVSNAGQKGMRVTYGAMFAAMTQKFDQGYKGLLLNNAPIGREGNPYLDRDFARAEYNNRNQQNNGSNNNNNNNTLDEESGGIDLMNQHDDIGGIRVSGIYLKPLKNTNEDGSPRRSSQHHQPGSPSKNILDDDDDEEETDGKKQKNNTSDDLPPLAPGGNNNNAGSSDDFNTNNNNYDDDNIEDNFDEGYENYASDFTSSSALMMNSNKDGEAPQPRGSTSNKSLGLQPNYNLSRAGSVANALSRAQSVANESLHQLQQDAMHNQNSLNISEEARFLSTGFKNVGGNSSSQNLDDDNDFGGDNDYMGYDDDDNNNNNTNTDDDGFAIPSLGDNNNKNKQLSALAAEDGSWQPLNQQQAGTGKDGSGSSNPALLRFNNPTGGNSILKTIRQGTKIGNSTEAILRGIDDVTLASRKKGSIRAGNKKNLTGHNENSDDDDNDDDNMTDDETASFMMMSLGQQQQQQQLKNASKKAAKQQQAEASLNLDDLRNFDRAFNSKLKQGKHGQYLVDSLPTAEKLKRDYTKQSFTKDRAIEKKLLLPRATTPEQDQLAWWLPRLAARDVTCYYQPFCAPDAATWNLLAKYSSAAAAVATGGGANNQNGGAETFGQAGDDFGGGDYDDFGGGDGEYDGDDEDVEQDEQLANGMLDMEGMMDDDDDFGMGGGFGDDNNNGDFVSAQDLLKQHNEDAAQQRNSDNNKNSELLKLIEPPASIDLGQFVIPAALVQINVVALRERMWRQLERLADMRVTHEHWQSILEHKDIQNDLRRDAAELAARGDPKAQAAIRAAVEAADEEEDNQLLLVAPKNASGKRTAPVSAAANAKTSNTAILPDPEPNRPACIFSEVVLSMLPYHKHFVSGGSLAPAFYFFSLLFLANEKGLLMVPLRIQSKTNRSSTHCEDVLVLMPPQTPEEYERKQAEKLQKRLLQQQQKLKEQNGAGQK